MPCFGKDFPMPKLSISATLLLEIILTVDELQHKLVQHHLQVSDYCLFRQVVFRQNQGFLALHHNGFESGYPFQTDALPVILPLIVSWAPYSFLIL